MWVAADRGARLAREVGREDIADRWDAKADEFKEEICEKGCRDGIFRQHYDTDALDASLLLMPLYRFLPGDDPRIVATVKAIADELTEEGLVLRYKVDETDDGLSGEEGTFLICSFWLVSALSEIGEREHARELCERLLAASGCARPLRRGAGGEIGPPPRQLPPGLHPPGADQRRLPRDRRRAERGGRRRRRLHRDGRRPRGPVIAAHRGRDVAGPSWRPARDEAGPSWRPAKAEPRKLRPVSSAVTARPAGCGRARDGRGCEEWTDPLAGSATASWTGRSPKTRPRDGDAGNVTASSRLPHDLPGVTDTQPTFGPRYRGPNIGSAFSDLDSGPGRRSEA